MSVRKKSPSRKKAVAKKKAAAASKTTRASRSKTKSRARPARKSPARASRAPGRPSIPVTPALRQRALALFDELDKAYPDAHCELDFTNALEALIATILAAQCTDARVNMVTPALFAKYRTPADYLAVPDEVLQDEIRSTGFYNNKTKAIKAACRLLVDEFGGRMPSTMEELVRLPGVGRKTANVILANIHGVPGVVVDTHMLRLSNRMGFSTNHEADKVERDMMAVFPEALWIRLSHLIPWHGRRCCTARAPMCDACPVSDECPKLIA